MDNKTKEPLLSLMLSCFIPGAGQMYSGYVQRGVVLIAAPCLIFGGLGWYVIQPEIKLHNWMLGIVILGCLFGLFILIDSYLCAKRFNKEHNLVRSITTGKRMLYIMGIIMCLLFIDIGSIFSNYVKNHIVQAFQVSSDAMSPTLIKGDRILVDKKAQDQNSLKRGDVIVFSYPEDETRELIKRVIAFEGETVEIKEGDVSAFNALADRMEGKPKQGIDQNIQSYVQMPMITRNGKEVHFDIGEPVQ